MVTLQLKQIHVLPGQCVVFQDVSWGQFEEILEELGEHRGARIVYSRGRLELMTPLPEHEVAKVLVGDLVKILLEELAIDCESFGSTTFKRRDMEQGIEPDDSFYIQNHERMIGKRRIDLTVDPPPDLAIEIDLTSKTSLEVYEALGVPELWRYENHQLRINVLRDGHYEASNLSPTFPHWPIPEVITQFVEQGRTTGRSKALRAFRAWIQEHRSTAAIAPSP